MRKIILALCAIVIVSNVFGQDANVTEEVNSIDKFVVSTVGSKYSKAQIEEAFSLVDWCGYHFESTRHSIKLDDGSALEFKSAAELGNLSQECISPSFEDTKTYSIHPTKTIIIKVEKETNVKVSAAKK